MRKCPNCGQAAERTEDWACQWCGYPLLSKSYKKIPKTYQQLKGGKPPEPEAVAEPQPEPVLAPEPEAVAEPQPEPVPAPEPEAVAEPQPEPVPAPEPEAVAEPQPEPVPAPEPEAVAEPQPKPKPGTAGITVEELYSDFSVDRVTADARFADKTLTVTGIADRITVNDVHDIYYIILASAEKKEQWNVRCTFDKKDGPQLNRLTAGQAVTVRGEYNGYKANILMKDCVLVS